EVVGSPGIRRVQAQLSCRFRLLIWEIRDKMSWDQPDEAIHRVGRLSAGESHGRRIPENPPMSRIRLLGIVAMSAATLTGPDAIHSPARGGEPSAERQADLQRLVQRRRQRRMARLAQQQPWLAQQQAWLAQQQARSVGVGNPRTFGDDRRYDRDDRPD